MAKKTVIPKGRDRDPEGGSQGDHSPDPRQVVTKTQFRAIRDRLAGHVVTQVAKLATEPAEQLHLKDLTDEISAALVHHGLICDHTPAALRLVAELIELRNVYIEHPGQVH